MTEDFSKENEKRMLAALAMLLGMISSKEEWKDLSEQQKKEVKRKYEDRGLQNIAANPERISERDIQMQMANTGVSDGVDWYKIVGVKDDKTCPDCRSWQGKIVSMFPNNKGFPLVQDFINQHGFHFNCRCSLQESESPEHSKSARNTFKTNVTVIKNSMENIEDTIDNGESEVQITTVGTVIGSDVDGNPIEQNFSEDSLKKIAENFKDKEILVDKDHSSEEGGSTEAAGWATDFKFKEGKGLFGRIKWTNIGKALISNRVFRWLSPSFLLNDKKEPVEMTYIALTNKPAQAGRIDPIVNSAPVQMELEFKNEEENLPIKDTDMTKEEIIELIKTTFAELMAENKKACSEEAVEEVKEVKEETKEEEVKEPIPETPKEEKKEEAKEEVIKIEALNSAPTIVASEPEWKKLKGKDFFDWCAKHPTGV